MFWIIPINKRALPAGLAYSRLYYVWRACAAPNWSGRTWAHKGLGPIGVGRRLAPAPQLHPAKQRLERHDPQNACNQIENGLNQNRPSPNPRGQAADGDGPDHDQCQDHENASRFAPAWLLLFIAHVVRPPQLIYSCSVKIASIRISVGSQVIISNS